MTRLTYDRTEISTGQTITFCHRCRTEAVLVLALQDYQDINPNLYTKAKLKVFECGE